MSRLLRGELKARIERGFHDGTRIYITHSCEDGAVAIARPLTMQTLKEEDRGSYQPPTIHLMDDDTSLLQSIVDQAWDMGIRPRYAKETTPEVNAVKHHLEDMRRIVFHSVGFDGKKA